MRSRLHPVFIVAGAFGALAGCSDYHPQERPPWRAQAEEVCLAKGLVRESASIRAFHEMSGPGICGAVRPFRVTALDGGAVALNSTQTLDCPMIAALDGWVRDVVQPAAEARFGERVARIDSMGSYSCRGINNVSGASLSEHAFANAMDVGGFVLASGRKLNIRRGFDGADEAERAFLHEAHAGACSQFTTVLGPGSNVFHYDHFHLDLAMHGSTSRGPRRTCKPVPQPDLPAPPVRDRLPDPPAIDEEMDVARAPLPEPAYRSGPPSLVASVPPPPPATPRAQFSPPRGTLTLAPPADVDLPARVRAPRPEPTAPPLITFADGAEEESAEAPAQRRPAAARPLAAASPARPAQRRDAEPPATAEGSPRDWDLTSSIDR